MGVRAPRECDCQSARAGPSRPWVSRPRRVQAGTCGVRRDRITPAAAANALSASPSAAPRSLRPSPRCAVFPDQCGDRLARRAGGGRAAPGGHPSALVLRQAGSMTGRLLSRSEQQVWSTLPAGTAERDHQWARRPCRRRSRRVTDAATIASTLLGLLRTDADRAVSFSPWLVCPVDHHRASPW